MARTRHRISDCLQSVENKDPKDHLLRGAAVLIWNSSGRAAGAGLYLVCGASQLLLRTNWQSGEAQSPP